jgi:hypothetical protein
LHSTVILRVVVSGGGGDAASAFVGIRGVAVAVAWSPTTHHLPSGPCSTYDSADLLREEATTRAAEQIWGTGELPVRKQKRRGSWGATGSQGDGLTGG